MRGWRAKKDREGSKRESLNFQIKPGRKRKLSLILNIILRAYTLPKQIMKSCNAKESVKTTRVT